MKRKKKAYLLLELILALSLLALFIGPLVQAPFSHIRKQLKGITAIQFSLAAETILASVEEKLLKNLIPWKKIEEAQTSAIHIETVSWPTDVRDNPSSKSPSYEARIYLSKAHIEQKDLTTDYGWVTATVIFVPSNRSSQEKETRFSSTFFLLKKPLHLSTNATDES